MADPHTGVAWDRATRRAMVEPFGVLWAHLVVDDGVGDGSPGAGALFCFGSRHHRVPERAAALHRSGIAARILVTGAAPPGEERAEADHFAAELRRRGVAEADLLIERTATNTGENVRYGLDLLRRHGEVRDLVIVCWPLGARRCVATFARQAPEVSVRAAPALWRAGWSWAPTARRARFALGELERLERYAGLGFLHDEPTPPAVRDAAAVLRAALEPG